MLSISGFHFVCVWEGGGEHFLHELRDRVPSFSGILGTILAELGPFLHFSFCVKLKIETQNTFFSKYTSIILYNHQYSL